MFLPSHFSHEDFKVLFWDNVYSVGQAGLTFSPPASQVLGSGVHLHTWLQLKLISDYSIFIIWITYEIGKVSNYWADILARLYYYQLYNFKWDTGAVNIYLLNVFWEIQQSWGKQWV